jgi:hypothetical protein
MSRDDARPVAYTEPASGNTPGLVGAPAAPGAPALGSAAEGYGALLVDPAATR